MSAISAVTEPKVKDARLSAGRAFLLNAAFVAALLVLSQLPLLDERPVVRSSIVGGALFLLAWNVLLFGLLRRGQPVTLVILLRPQHYLQACMQGLVIVYWGLYWPEVQNVVPLVAAQLLFAYGFDSLLSWTHRRSFILGFGSFPIVFSITLFLWFRDPFFYWQLVMVAVALLGKEFLRWNRDGRNTHIFNPSAFPLAVASLSLLLFDATDMTWGSYIAQTQFWPPHAYLAIFLISLPGQYLFGVAPMTLAAVTTTFLFSQIYYAATGTFYFVDSHVPIAVFLGMHLLFTDPSTSPRTLVGRVLFGMLYGLSTVGLYWLLLLAVAPAFFDKLLQVPVLNLLVKWIDRIASSPKLKALDPAVWASNWAPHRRHLLYAGTWVGLFVAMSASGYLGDRHPGQYTPFWDEACAADRPNACLNLYALHEGYCTDGSGWSCNEMGVLLVERYQNLPRAAEAFERACMLDFAAGCDNQQAVQRGGAIRRRPPTPADYPYIVRGSKGPITDADPDELEARACELGFPGDCGRP